MTPADLEPAVGLAKSIKRRLHLTTVIEGATRHEQLVLSEALIALAERCKGLERENFDLRTAVMEMHSLRLNVQGEREALWRLRQAANNLAVPFDYAAALDVGKETP